MKALQRRFIYPSLAYVFIVAALFFADPDVSAYVYVLFLFLPLLDPDWSLPNFRIEKRQVILTVACAICVAGVLTVNQGYTGYFFSMLVLTALPEEWFFRAYLLARVGFNLPGHTIVSAAFSAIHGIHQNTAMMLLVFLPSLLFGLVYQYTRNIYLVVMLHALSNLVFVIYIRDVLAEIE